MSERFNPWKLKYKKSFHKRITGNQNIRDPVLFCNHEGNFCLDSRILFPHLPQFIQAAFIDPGKVSCAIRIVRYFLYNQKVELLWFGIHNFGIGIQQIITGVETELIPIREKLQLCHHIIVESQFMKNEVNFRTFQHMISYIESIVRNKGMKAMIFEVDIALKTVFISGPRNKNQYAGREIKEWSKLKARNELATRGDFVSYAILESSLEKQNEDLCDAFCYEFAWWCYIKKIKHFFIGISWLYELLK